MTRYTHKATTVFDGKSWRPAIMRGDKIAHTGATMYQDSGSAVQHAYDWLNNLRKKGQCYP